MKKLVLFIMTMMAFTGMSVAQSVWTAGYYTGSNGYHQAAVYENGEKRFESTPSINVESTSLTIMDGDVYWVKNAMNSDGTYYYGDVMKNDNAYPYLDSPTDEGRHINALFQFDGGIIAAGCMNINNKRTAVAWVNDDVDPFQLGDAVYASEATCGTVGFDGDVFIGGWQNTSSGFHGVIWYEDGVFDLPDNTAVFGMDFYDGDVYSVGYSYEDSRYSVKVWKNTTELGTLTSLDNDGKGISIHVDAGDVYVAGWEGFTLKIWKNGELIQSLSGSGQCGFWDVQVNSDGVYYAGQYSGKGKVWKDGGELYSPTSCDFIYDMYVEEPTCTNLASRTLPYFEGFEIGETDWACWTKDDEDDQNEDMASYWQRGGVGRHPYSGDYCAYHMYGPQEIEQEGWLVSPLISIPEGGSIMMTFMTYEGAVDSHYLYEGLWVYDGTNITELWSQPEMTASAEWKKVEVDLSAFKGEEIQLGFKYLGTFAHSWYIDDVSITQGDAPKYTITTEANPPEGGIVTGGGDFFEGETCTLNAIPNSGYTFVAWSDGSTENPHTITVTTSVNYVATFSQGSTTYYTVSAYASPLSSGTVEGTGPYPAGSTVTLVAIPAEGYAFKSWSDGVTTNPRTFVLNENVTLMAYFSGLGMDENESAVVLYPNPANNYIQIKGVKANSEVKIYNTMGALVKVVNANADEEIGINDLSSGLYFVRCGDVTLRFVKE